MPSLSAASIIFGLLIAVTLWKLLNRPNAPRRLPLWAAIAIVPMTAVLAVPLFTFLGYIPILSEFNGTTWFIGLWVALLALTVFERKGEARHVPIWAGVMVAAIAMFAIPKLLDTLTGSYQDASLKPNANACLQITHSDARINVTNTCSHPIIVGLCQSNESNPTACKQTAQLTPGGSATLNPNGEALSSLPSFPNGYTLVACQTEHRPSRTKKVGGKGHRGVCLP